jgi:hypothetical protein
MRTVGVITAMMVAAALGACGRGEAGRASRTEHERDSVTGQSKLPGARGVRGALEAGDSARARNASLDSISTP